MHCGWPALACVQELLLGALREVSNHTLDDSILEMGIDPAKGELLAALLTCLSKSIVHKTTIIAMVMFDYNAMFSSKLLKCLFHFYCYVARHVLHERDEAETGEVIHKDRCNAVPLRGKFTLKLGEKSHVR
jgi:hypothetical protein